MKTNYAYINEFGFLDDLIDCINESTNDVAVRMYDYNNKLRETSTNDGYISSPYLLVESIIFQPQSLYDFSTASLSTAGIAAYMGQQTLNISTNLSRCSKI